MLRLLDKISWIKNTQVQPVRLLYLLLFMLLAESYVYSQQSPTYSQYMMNQFLINPARAGSYSYTTLSLVAREQWIGLQESPKTHAIAGQTRLLNSSYINRSQSVRNQYKKPHGKGRVGLGGYLFNDRHGIIDRTGAQMAYAYHIPIQHQQLSFGLSLSLTQYTLDEQKIVLFDDPMYGQEDPLIWESRNALFIPDATIGVFYRFPRFYSGLSVSQLFQSSLTFENEYAEKFRIRRHYYGMAGYVYRLNREYEIEPSILIKSTEQFNMQFDINCRVFYRNDYWGGLTYRTLNALIVMGGIKIDKFLFGYAFDFTFASIQKHNYGSHEFTIVAKFGDDARRYRWLERY